MLDGSQEAWDVLDRQHLWHPLTQHQAWQTGGAPIVLTRGEGSQIFDQSGRGYLDASAGLWCVAVGHGRRELAEAAFQQMETLAFYPLTQSHPAAIDLAARLGGYLPDNPRVYFTGSGSEANEVAFKVVRQYWQQAGQPQRLKILSRQRSYHGSTLGALSASGQPERQRGYEPLAPGFLPVVPAPYCYRCPLQQRYPDCGLACADELGAVIEREGPETVAAVIVEPVGAGGGALVPPEGYLPRVAAIARSYGVKLIVDEVVTGFGRTGAMFCHRADGVTADIVTMAKGLASGYMPIGAAAFSDDLFQSFLGAPDDRRHLRHINTFSGHPVATRVALANLAIIEREGLVERSRKWGGMLGAWLKESLSGFPEVGDIRGRGLFWGIEVVDPMSGAPASDARMREIVARLAAQGILLGKTTDVVADRNNVLICAPPLIIQEEELAWLIEGLVAVLGAQPGQDAVSPWEGASAQ
jgi:taurine-pyruvate aminotransferase